MKKLLLSLFGIGVVFLFMPSAAFAADTTPITQYTSDILGILTLLATLFSTIFLIKGGYTYMTSSGNPQALRMPKKQFVMPLSDSRLSLVLQQFHQSLPMHSEHR